MNYSLEDTIVAIATPPGAGGVGIVRLSGPKALFVLREMTGRNEFKPRYLHHGWIHAVPEAGEPDEHGGREKLDDALCVYMPGPASFTGEDVAEVHCHGGQAILLAVVASACRLGARMAEKGEFTYRAFVNGKYDLTQAEAVAEMIAAPSRQGLRLAQAKLSGLLGQRVDELREILETLRAKAALAIDFSEEEAEALDSANFSGDLATVQRGIKELLAGYKRARHWREGVPVMLAGRVNVGKSSLLNALLGKTRAIVSATPGTTRDFIEESLDLDGLAVRIADTAGLRTSADPVEMEGVARAMDLAKDAALVVFVTDASGDLSDEERVFLRQHAGRVLVVRNKIDLLPKNEKMEALAVREFEGEPSAAVSAKAGLGLENLAAELRRTALALAGASDADPKHGDIIPNMRQSELLAAALAETGALLEDVAAGVPCDLFSVRLDAAAMYLGEITGFAATDDILGRIFSSFCIGK
jgi:tRNA modification GTPase